MWVDINPTVEAPKLLSILTPVGGHTMSKRIGHAQVEIKEIERNTNTPFQNDWQGTLILEGNKERFSTDIGNLSPNRSYFAVYERTEMLTGEPIVKIHEITDVQNSEPKST